MISEDFKTNGFAGPIKLFSTKECCSIVDYCNSESLSEPKDWFKGLAASDGTIYSIATDPQILSTVISLIGNNVILWGASLATRTRREKHLWHVDIECSQNNGSFVSAWIGLENCTKKSCLSFITHSHKFDKTIQQVVYEKKISRINLSNQNVVNLARECDERADLVIPDIRNGEVVFFDGRIWHYSYNTSWWNRTALLLQYASAESVLRMPDLDHLDWPFVFLKSPLPPVILVNGDKVNDINQVVPPPTTHGIGQLLEQQC